MFLLALALPPSFAATGCRISDVHLDLPLYIQLSTMLESAGKGPVSYGTNPDPFFDGDMPIEYTLIPTAGSLTLMVTHRELLATVGDVIDTVPVTDTFVIEHDGSIRDQNEKRRHSCSVRRAMATAALEKMHETYGF